MVLKSRCCISQPEAAECSIRSRHCRCLRRTVERTFHHLRDHSSRKKGRKPLWFKKQNRCFVPHAFFPQKWILSGVHGNSEDSQDNYPPCKGLRVSLEETTFILKHRNFCMCHLITVYKLSSMVDKCRAAHSHVSPPKSDPVLSSIGKPI